MKIKVCGMRHPDNIRSVAALPIDYAGFIFYPKSPRYVNALDREVISGLQAKGIEPVALFVDARLEDVMAAMSGYGFRAVQLHGNESPAYCDALRAAGYEVLKAVTVAGADDMARCSDYDGHADMLVIDTKCAGKGGSGQKFDWSLLQEARFDTPFMLSGGIGPDDVASIRKIYGEMRGKMTGVDLNSRFETEPGIKDSTLLAAFIEGIS